MKKIITMQGKALDFEKLALQNEHTNSVGNIKQPAPADDTTKRNRERRNKIMYRRQIHKKVVDFPVMESKDDATTHMETVAVAYIEEEKQPDDIKDIDQDTVQKIVPKTADIIYAPEMSKVTRDVIKEQVDQSPTDVMATVSDDINGAIAHAKSVDQQPDLTPREQLRNIDGVKKF